MLLLFEKLEFSNLDSACLGHRSMFWQWLTRKNVDTIFRQSLEQQPQEMRLLHLTVLVKNRVLAVVNWFRALLELTCYQAVLLALAPTFALSRKKMADRSLGGSLKCKLKLIQVNHCVCRDESSDVIALSVSLPNISLGHASIATSCRPSILYSSSYIATFRE